MKISNVTIRHLSIKHKVPFRTSFGSNEDKAFSIVELETVDGLKGYGECSANARPWYNEETDLGAMNIIEQFLAPALFSFDDLKGPAEFYEATNWIRRNKMARSAVDCALWDLYAQEQGIPLAKALGGTKTEVETGVSLGIEKTPDDLLRTIEKYLKQGYRRIKCKIEPGYDVAYMAAVRKEFGDILLQVDANSAYTLKDIEIFKELDAFNMLLIEQPLAHDDIVDHRHLQAVIKTPICLDESIHSAEDARKAIELGSCRNINIKVARVGGLTETKKIHDVCAEHGIPVWSGGMLDCGVARAHNIAVASLPNYLLPNDIPASDRYYAEDIVTPSTFIDNHGMIPVSIEPGLGFAINQEVVDKLTDNIIKITR